MKKLAIIILTLGITIMVGRSLLAPSVRAQSVEDASKDLSRTERDLRTAVRTTTTKANALQDRLGSTDRAESLPDTVKEFLTTTDRLTRLRDDLRQNIEHLATAADRTLAEFDQERSSITDPRTRRTMARLRSHADHQTQHRLAQARRALDLLDRALAQGSDVAHAAKCVQLAEELNVGREVINEQVRRATAEATAYTTMTTNLLSRLRTPGVG